MDTQEVTAVDISRIENELVKQNVTQAVLAKLKVDFLPLDKEITTKEERDIVHKAEMVCKSIRTTAVAICKKGREQALAEQRAWISKEKEVVAEIEEVEDKLKARKKDYDSIEARRVQEQAAAWAAKVNERKQALFDAGFAFNGTAYVLDNEIGGQYTFDVQDLEGPGFKDVEFGIWLEQVTQEVMQRREIKAEEELKTKEAAEALAVAQKAEADRLMEEKAAAERKQKELEAKERELNARINEGRLNELRALGHISVGINTAALWTLPSDEFDELKAYIQAEAETTAANERAAKAKELRRDQRANKLREAGVSFNVSAGLWSTDNCSCYWESVGNWTDEQFEEQFKEFTADIAESRRIAEQQRQEREEQLREEAAAAAVRAEQKRVAEAAQAVAMQEAEREKQEMEERARKGDKGQAELVLMQAIMIPIPTMTSEAGQAYAKRVAQAKELLCKITEEFIAK